MSAFAAPTRPFARKLAATAAAAAAAPTSPIALRTTTRGLCATMSLSNKLKPAARVSGQKQDVWYVVMPL